MGINVYPITLGLDHAYIIQEQGVIMIDGGSAKAIKEITGAGEGLAGRLFIYDGLYGESRTLVLHRRAECPVCGGGPRGGAAPA